MRQLLALYGIGLCTFLAFAASLLSHYVAIGAVAVAIVLGIVVGNSIRLGPRFESGIRFSEKWLLSFAIGLMGINLDFSILSALGYRSILLVVSGVLVTIGTALLLAKLLGFPRKFALLIGIGNSICGSSAIAATEKIIGADEQEVGLSIAIVNLLGTVGIFLVPLLATTFFHFSDFESGVLVGNTLQAVGQVIAGGFVMSDTAGQTAVIVKMTRILMLTPLIVGLLFVFSERRKSVVENGSGHRPAKVPLFIVGFALMTLIPTFSLLPTAAIQVIREVSHLALVIAMAGVGLRITFSSIVRDGRGALLIGCLTFALQIAFSGGMIAFLL